MDGDAVQRDTTIEPVPDPAVPRVLAPAIVPALPVVTPALVPPTHPVKPPWVPPKFIRIARHPSHGTLRPPQRSAARSSKSVTATPVVREDPSSVTPSSAADSRLRKVASTLLRDAVVSARQGLPVGEVAAMDEDTEEDELSDAQDTMTDAGIPQYPHDYTTLWEHATTLVSAVVTQAPLRDCVTWANSLWDLLVRCPPVDSPLFPPALPSHRGAKRQRTQMMPAEAMPSFTHPPLPPASSTSITAPVGQAGEVVRAPPGGDGVPESSRQSLGCYGCHEPGHVLSKCPRANINCFACGEFGHRLPFCPRRRGGGAPRPHWRSRCRQRRPL